MSLKGFDYFAQDDKKIARNMKNTFINGLNELEYAYKKVFKNDAELCCMYRPRGQKAYCFIVDEYEIDLEGDRQEFNRMLELCIKCKNNTATNQEMHELENMLCVRAYGYEYHRTREYRELGLLAGAEIIHKAVLAYILTREIADGWDIENIKKRWRIKGLRKDKEGIKNHSAKELLRIISKYEFLKAKMGGWRCYDRCVFYMNKYDKGKYDMPLSFNLILKEGTYVFSEETMEIEYWKSNPASPEELFQICLKDMENWEGDNATIGKNSELIKDEESGNSPFLEGALTLLSKCLEGLNELDKEDMRFIKVKLLSELDEWDIKWRSITHNIILCRLREQVETLYSTERKETKINVNLEVGNNIIISGVKQKSVDELIIEMEKRY